MKTFGDSNGTGSKDRNILNMSSSTSSWKEETKSAARRVTIGVVTAVVTSAVIYFLGFERGSKKADQAEIRKNSIRVWKEWIQKENALQPRHDTVFARAVRGDLTIEEASRLDSVISARYIDTLSTMASVPDIDQDLKSMIEWRATFKQEEWERARQYSLDFIKIRDTVAPAAYLNFLIEELNQTFNLKRDNAVERMGRTMEDMLLKLERKYKYPFQLKDFNWYPHYLRLKTVKREQTRPDDAPPPL